MNKKHIEKRAQALAFALGMGALVPTWATGQTVEEVNAAGAARRVIVKVADGTPVESIPRILARNGLVAANVKSLGGNGQYVVTLASVQNQNAITTNVGTLGTDTSIQMAEPDSIYTINRTPNDSRFTNLWGMRKISAPTAWDRRVSAINVVVAVIDTGIRTTHVDLRSNLWTNPREVAGNGRDDDGNGIVDDVHGANFVPSRTTGNPHDDNGHGTHCSGTIAGHGNNGTGVAGVAWRAKIMGLKSLNHEGRGFGSDLIAAVNYAAANGADVINASFGGGGYSSSMKAAIDAAGRRGVVFVAAAGNDSENNDTDPAYPASYTSSNIVSVGASTSSDGRAPFSNYGARSVDLFAPGVGIESTGHRFNTSYVSMSGTSMAAPHVTGAMALLKAQFPSESVAARISRVLTTTDRVTALQGRARYGRLNVGRAIGSTAPTPPSTDVGDTRATAKWVRIPSTTAEPLNRARDLDFFRFSLTQPAAIVAQTTGSTDTYGHLLDAQGRQLAYNDDGGSGRNFRIARTLAAGTYFVKVRGYSSTTTGAYSLALTAASTGTPEVSLHGLSGRTILTADRTPSATDGTLFGTIQVGRELIRTFTIRNTGRANLTVRNPRLIQGQAAQFRIISRPATVVRPGSSTSIRIGYRPRANGRHQTIFAFTTNDSNERVHWNYIRGIGRSAPSSDIPGVPRNNSPYMRINTNRTITIDRARDRDVVRVYVPRTGRLDTFTTYTGSRLDSYLHLWQLQRGQIRQIRVNDDSGSGFNARIATRVPRGWYWVGVRAYSSSRTGTTNLAIRFR